MNIKRLLLMKKVFILALLAFSMAAFAGCGKKAPPRAPGMAAGAAMPADGPFTI